MATITAAGDCLLTSMRFKEIDTLEGIFSVGVERGGYLVWESPEWLKVLRKQVQFNQVQDKTAWIWKD